MKRIILAVTLTCASLTCLAGCGTGGLAAPSLADLLRLLLPTPSTRSGDAGASETFIQQGTFELRQTGFLSEATCPVWVDDTGLAYHLFQGAMITSAQFDQITTPGTTSRLQLQFNNSLQVGCLTDSPIVEVVGVLEVSP